MKHNKGIAILSVVYAQTEEHKNIITRSFESIPESFYKATVVNDNTAGVDIKKYNDKVIKNPVNCLAKAWNMGLEFLFEEKDYQHVLVTNLDVSMPSNLAYTLYRASLKNTKAGMWAANPSDLFSHLEYSTEYEVTETTPMKHGDGSFSCFLLSREAYEIVGKFDENYTPAYFEDCDYLERLWAAGYEPVKVLNARYFHFVQGTIKLGTEEKKTEYSEFMQKNLEYFQKTYGKTPEHLPQDIKFN